MIKQALKPTWQKMAATLLLMLMVAIQAWIVDTSGSLAHAVNQHGITREQKEYREKVRAVSERFSCERDSEIEKIPYPARGHSPASTVGITLVSSSSMLLVCYLFACMVLHLRRPVESCTTGGAD